MIISSNNYCSYNFRIIPVFLVIIIFHTAICPVQIQGKIVEKWYWSGGTTMPDYKYVVATPLVINLSDDNSDSYINLKDTPDIVFIARDTPGTANGILRAISGDDAREIFTVTDPAHHSFTRTCPAAGDIDDDGFPEIITVHEDRLTPMAFEHDGTFKWLGEPDPHAIELNGVLSIADLNQDGEPEIIFGSTVWDIEGNLKWRGLFGVGGYWFKDSSAVDLNCDGNMEVIAGYSAYNWDGSYHWLKPLLPDGMTSIGDFDLDGSPEIVLIDDHYHYLYMLESDGSTRWGPFLLPGSGIYPSGITIADFHGDTHPEIVLTKHKTMFMYDRTGSLLWSKILLDDSGASTPSAFDIDLDGKYEIIYNDEEFIYIIRGEDGVILDSAPFESSTDRECPVIADVDNDGEADIVCVSSYGNPGVMVFSGQGWPGTRPIWNQFNYRITNVQDLGGIPVSEPYNWLIINNYRAQISYTPSCCLPIIEKPELFLLCSCFGLLFFLFHYHLITFHK